MQSPHENTNNAAQLGKQKDRFPCTSTRRKAHLSAKVAMQITSLHQTGMFYLLMTLVHLFLTGFSTQTGRH